jgi:type I restriction enzyme S subunit
MESSEIGNFGFQQLSLDEICLKITDGSHSSPPETKDGVPMYSVKDMTNYGFSDASVKRISEADYLALVKNGCQPEVGDVLIAKDGSVLKHVMTFDSEVTCALLSSIAILRPNPKIMNSKYLAYSMKSPQVQDNVRANYVSGSGVPRIVLKDFKKILIEVPDLITQNGLVSMLGPIDEKIRINLQIASTLEQIAQTVFKSWFVDHDPVHAKARGEQPEGMDEETTALFTDSFEESENGPIPSGWEVLSLGKVVDLAWGDTKTTKASYVESGYRAFSAKGQDGYLEKYDYDQPGIVLSAIGAGCGKTWLALDKWSCIKNTIRMIANSEYANAIPYIFYLTNKVDFWEKRGSAQPFIGQEDSRQKVIVVPTKPLLEKFEVFSRPIFQQLHEIEIQNNYLLQILDTLLPRLISGELEIPVELLEA